MIEHDVEATGLERGEHLAVERRHIGRPQELVVQIVLILRDPEQVERLGKIEAVGEQRERDGGKQEQPGTHRKPRDRIASRMRSRPGLYKRQVLSPRTTIIMGTPIRNLPLNALRSFAAAAKLRWRA